MPDEPETPPTPAPQPPPHPAPIEADDTDETPMDTGDDRRSRRSAARERRAENVAKTTPSGATFRKYRVHAVLLLLGLLAMGGVHGYYVYETTHSEAGCPGHWHSTVMVYVNGQAIDYNSPNFILGNTYNHMPIGSHMHQGSAGVWHWEPPTGACQQFNTAMHYLDTDLQPGKLTLSGPVHQGRGVAGEYPNDATHMLRAFQSLSGGDWQEISVGDLAGRQPRDQERDLIVYGPMDDPAIPTYEANMATSPSMPAAEPHSYPLVPIIGIGVLTLVALAVWNSLSRKV